jgi:integrase
MARKRTRVKAHTQRLEKAAKLATLAERPGTTGEQKAAEVALQRMGATPDDVKWGKLAILARERKAALKGRHKPEGRARKRDLAPEPKKPTTREHLTDAAVKKLPAPQRGNRVTYDEVAGFGIRVTAAGARAFILNYRTKAGRERRITIGGFPNWSTVAARVEARRLKQEIDRGSDPLADIADERAAPTMAELADRFIAEHVNRKRATTARDYGTMLTKYIRPHFGAHTKVADVQFENIDALHRKITNLGFAYQANRCMAVLSKMFSLAVKWRMRPDNPAKGVERNTESKRARYLSGDELGRLTKALAKHLDQQSANVIRLLLLTGARKGEVLGARWGDLDLTAGTWSKPASSVKQNEAHHVPLSAPARQLLSEIADAQAGKHRRGLGEFVFPGPGGSGHQVDIKDSWRSLCKAAGISGLRVHDLRHSFAPQLASGGASLPLIGALLGHSNPTTTHRYAHLFDDPQRAAVERVGAVITAAGKDAKQPAQFKSSYVASPTKRGR